MELRICQLEYSAGRTRRCPGDTCPYWVGWVSEGCAVSRYWADFGSDPELTELLLDLRERLASRDSRRAFRQFHPPGLA
jgi:hypothetical protein